MLTIDVEDWQQSVVDHTLPVSERVVVNTRRMLAILRRRRVQATIFVQSLVAERYPDLVREIAHDGHEIGSHGRTHLPIFALTPQEFATEVEQSLETLSPLADGPILGFRAPSFSIRQDTLWALPIIRDAGLRYSSSIFPFRGRRYGIGDAALSAHEVIPGLLEVPPTIVTLAGRRVPVAGGGYLRLVPSAVTHAAIRRVHREGRPAVVYLHPYELDTSEVGALKAHAPMRLRVTQGLNRRFTERKLDALLEGFAFAPIRDVVPIDTEVRDVQQQADELLEARSS
jgi:polysaccharide deacetylase family protein (PEP-CTERM system associated)